MKVKLMKKIKLVYDNHNKEISIEKFFELFGDVEGNEILNGFHPTITAIEVDEKD